MLLVSPPEWILFEYLVLLEILTHSPTFIISQGQSVLLKQCVDARNSTIPAIFQIIQRKSSILS